MAVAALATPAMAQEPMMTDPAGDQEVQFGGVDSPTDSHAEIDLVSATFVEHRDMFEVRLGFSSLERGTGSTGGMIGGDFARLAFSYEGKAYAADFHPYRDLDNQVYGFAYLSEYDPGRDEYAAVEQMTYEIATETNELVGTFQRDAIHAPDGSPVAKDGVFDGFWAESLRDMQVFGSAIPAPAIESAYDRMPDERSAAATHIVEHGLAQSGHARLDSDEAFRISNGEATTFLYRLEAQNVGDRRDMFALSAHGVPDQWDVTFPEERLRIEADSAVEVPILVTVPFNHKHGTVASMEAHLTSQTDPNAVGRLEIGVRYTSVPQPAGHHDTLYIHSGAEQRYLASGLPLLTFHEPSYFNTVEDYEFDTGLASEPNRLSCNNVGMSYVFAMDLVPGIGMGLDFDLARMGLFEGTLRAQTPTSGMAVRGELYYMPAAPSGRPSEDGKMLLATLEPASAQPMDADETRDVSLAITPTKDADYVRHIPGSVLRFELWVDDQPVTSMGMCHYMRGQEPLLEPGAWFQLPLDEYHDDVSDYFRAASGIDLYAIGSQRKLINPGAAVLFNLTAENTGTQAGTFDLELAGSQTEWASILEGDRLRLEPGARRDIHVTVRAPDDAADGTVADLTLHATARVDTGARSVVRLVAEVDTEGDHADESALVEKLAGGLDKKSPGLSALVLGAGVVLFAARRRHGR